MRAVTGRRVLLRTRREDDDRVRLDVVDRASGEQVGEALLDVGESGAAAVRVSLAAGDPEHATEATRLVVDHGIRTLGLQRISLADGTEVRASHLDPDYPVLTARLALRPIDPGRDVPAMNAYRSREDVCRFTPLVPGSDEALAERLRDPERVRSVIDADGQNLSLVIERRDTGELVGDVILFWRSATHGHAEIGYVLHPDHTGQGFATEAGTALLALAFGGPGIGLGAHRVTAHLDARNAASAAVAERLGMRLETTAVDGEWFKGQWSTSLVYAMLRREWEARPG